MEKYATATFKVLNAYAGWANINYVLNDVKNPVRTLKIAGPLGLGITTVLYMMANIAYFAYVSISHVNSPSVSTSSWFSFSLILVLDSSSCHAGMSARYRC